MIEAERIRGGGCAVVLRTGCDGKKEWCVRCNLLKHALAVHNTRMDRTAAVPVVTPRKHAWEMADGPLTPYEGGTRYKWRRGFIEGVATRTADFVRCAADLFGRCPLAAVLLTDSRPYQNESSRYCWAREPMSERRPRSRRTRHFIGSLFWHLPDRPPSTGWVWSYDSEPAAMAALSAAAVGWGRKLAGLPPLTDTAAPAPSAPTPSAASPR